MSIPRTDELLRLIPIRFRPVPMPDREIIKSVANDVTMGALEQAFCMDGRQQFKEVIQEELNKYVQGRLPPCIVTGKQIGRAHV